MSIVSIIYDVAVSILLFTVTVFIDNHTYFTKFYNNTYIPDLNRPVPTPLVAWLVLIVAYVIPVVNIFFFFLGTVVWVATALNDEITFGNPPKWLINLVNFLSKPIKF